MYEVCEGLFACFSVLPYLIISAVVVCFHKLEN